MAEGVDLAVSPSAAAAIASSTGLASPAAPGVASSPSAAAAVASSTGPASPTAPGDDSPPAPDGAFDGTGPGHDASGDALPSTEVDPMTHAGDALQPSDAPDDADVDVGPDLLGATPARLDEVLDSEAQQLGSPDGGAGTVDASLADAGAAEAGPEVAVAEAGASVPNLDRQPADPEEEVGEDGLAAEADMGDAREGGAPEGLASAEPSIGVTRIDMPELQLDFNARDRLAGSAAEEADANEAITERTRSAVANVLEALDRDLSEMAAGEIRTALENWRSKLAHEAQDLQAIVQQARSIAANVRAAPGASARRDAAPTAVSQELDDCGEKEVCSAWADPEETLKEVEELRRVRRQIRYLFGGMLGSLPDSSNLQVDDIIPEEERGDSPNAPGAVQHNSAGDRSQLASDVLAAVGSPAPGALEPSSRRPRSTGTEKSSATTSSVGTWASQATMDEERRKERREKKHRRHGSHRRREEVPQEPVEREKKDDGAPPRRHNWAEEVVKATLDPQNQWEFPGAVESGRPARRLPLPGVSPWEQPRQAGSLGGFGGPGQRGEGVALKTRERAEELLRSERGNARTVFGAD